MTHDFGLEKAAVEKKLRACEPINYKDHDGCCCVNESHVVDVEQELIG